MTTARATSGRGTPRRRKATGERPTPASAALDAPARVAVPDPAEVVAAEQAARVAAAVAEQAPPAGLESVEPVVVVQERFAADPVSAVARVVGDAVASAVQFNELLLDDATGQMPDPDGVFVPFGHSGTAVTAVVQLNRRIVHPSGSVTEQIMVPRGGLVDVVTAGRIIGMLERQAQFAV